MILWLLLALTIVRPYHHVTVDSMATTRVTHVQLVGLVTFKRLEGDGDKHFRVSDPHGHFVVCEILRVHPLPMPEVGRSVLVRGVRRFDDAAGHGWWEIHLVESWEYVK